MIFDIASLLPLQFSGNPDAEYFLRLFRIFKMHRLFKMINADKINRYLADKFFKNNLLSSKKFLIIITYVWSIFYQILAMLFFSYALSCI